MRRAPALLFVSLAFLALLTGCFGLVETLPPSQPPPPDTPRLPLQTYTGQGQSVSPFFALGRGLTLFRMEHDGSSNFIVWLLDDQGDRVDLLVNEIGGFDGGKAIGVDAPGTHLLDIKADGNWTISVEQPAPGSGPGLYFWCS